ncbi:alpha,alpha-trehalose-phosphate synthase (UDP-forming) [Thermomonospora curvata]|uniref:Alpha,alpha-trehalose-phosphate synthase (UDP-forming) n=1 Tax=Thermomonospora curvata (strain ATCC 19995 / DSM 43183 / JCM 3096 / KCTC 9072 / NBRC 15933 / NCIMB 10081 / Henssen B9) TaxID=471852 RepID=D1A5N1_THECD|nr:trehalose-6-phosphate synthase [Thermomonospora curvata]ACY96391.1 Alpha,alpha-trehalose-phosphate synthase (UDP- forming) [Thermomonospora curvata DSM 43183]
MNDSQGGVTDGQVLVASNRGPVSFSLSEDGALTMRRGGGGLVSGLAAVAAKSGPHGEGGPEIVWVCAALSDADRLAARQAPDGRLDKAGHDTGGASVRMLGIPAATFQRAYNGVANSTLWFVHHMLYDTPNAPHFDARARRDWQSYEAYNAAFADALARDAAHGAKTAIQDYHLALAPRMLRERRPDLKIAHFSHTPWAPPEYYRMLPDDIGVQVLEGILGADHAGFLAERWAAAFLDCCEALLHAKVDRAARTVSYRGHLTRIGVHGLGVDGAELIERARREDVRAREQALREQVGDRQLIVRIDRTELSKNIVRGLAAYRELLTNHPEWRGRVVHLAFAYPSRHDLPEYRRYTEQVRKLADQIVEEFATPTWQPLILQVNDDYPRSLAAYRMADVLLVNPIRDGMNLVAKEGPVLSRNGCALVLSREAGAAADLGEDALLINPFDVSQTAETLHRALLMSPRERAERCRRLAAAATALPPQRWFADQLAAL